MSGISRRALFGLSVGAAATAVVPAEVQPEVIGLDFGTRPAMWWRCAIELDIEWIDGREFTHVERCG